MSGTLAQQTISFDEIAYTIRRPSTQLEIHPSYANIGLVQFPTRALLIGLMLPAGAGASGQPLTVYQIYQRGHATALFGPGSMLAGMAELFVAANPDTPLYCVGILPPVAATVAGCTLTVSTATVISNTTLPVYVGSRSYPVVLRTTDSGSVQAANIAAAVNADPYRLVQASAAGAVVTLTARQGGEWGNALTCRIGIRGDSDLPAGGWAAAITPFTGGAGAPDITAVLALVANDWFTDIGCGFTDTPNISALSAELDTRYTATGRKDATAYVGYATTQGGALAVGPTLNSRFLPRMPAANCASPPWEWAAVICAIASRAFDNDPSRQLRGLALPGILPPAPADRYSDSAREQLLRNGMSTFGVLSDGTVTFERLITSYQTSPLGIADTAWLDVMTPKTMTRIRYDWASYLGLVWPRAKLADDDSVAAQFNDIVATPRKIQNSWLSRSILYEQQGWIEGAAQTAKASTFLRDASDRNRLNARQVVRQIGNMMVFAGRLEFEV